MAKKPTMYVDTNVFSLMFYDSGDSAGLGEVIRRSDEEKP